MSILSNLDTILASNNSDNEANLHDIIMMYKYGETKAAVDLFLREKYIKSISIILIDKMDKIRQYGDSALNFLISNYNILKDYIDFRSKRFEFKFCHDSISLSFKLNKFNYIINFHFSFDFTKVYSCYLIRSVLEKPEYRDKIQVFYGKEFINATPIIIEKAINFIKKDNEEKIRFKESNGTLIVEDKEKSETQYNIIILEEFYRKVLEGNTIRYIYGDKKKSIKYSDTNHNLQAYVNQFISSIYDKRDEKAIEITIKRRNDNSYGVFCNITKNFDRNIRHITIVEGASFDEAILETKKFFKFK